MRKFLIALCMLAAVACEGAEPRRLLMARHRSAAAADEGDQYTENLVAHYRFAADADPQPDEIGVNDASVEGSATWTGGAVDISANGDYLNAGNDSSLNLQDHWSISMWVNTDDSTKYYPMIYSKLPQFEVSMGNSTGRLTLHGLGSADTVIADGVWTHLALVYNGATVQYYFDGQPDGSVVRTSDFPSSSGDTHLGARASVLSIDGKFDEFRIYDAAKSADDIEGIYNLGR